jgi:hypothetical protein
MHPVYGTAHGASRLAVQCSGVRAVSRHDLRLVGGCTSLLLPILEAGRPHFTSQEKIKIQNLMYGSFFLFWP